MHGVMLQILRMEHARASGDDAAFINELGSKAGERAGRYRRAAAGPERAR